MVNCSKNVLLPQISQRGVLRDSNLKACMKGTSTGTSRGRKRLRKNSRRSKIRNLWDAPLHLRFKLIIFNNWDQRDKTMTINTTRSLWNLRDHHDQEITRTFPSFRLSHQREVSKCSLRDRKEPNSKRLRKMQYSWRTTARTGKMKSPSQNLQRSQILSYLTYKRS